MEGKGRSQSTWSIPRQGSVGYKKLLSETSYLAEVILKWYATCTSIVELHFLLIRFVLVIFSLATAQSATVAVFLDQSDVTPLSTGVYLQIIINTGL